MPRPNRRLVQSRLARARQLQAVVPCTDSERRSRKKTCSSRRREETGHKHEQRRPAAEAQQLLTSLGLPVQEDFDVDSSDCSLLSSLTDTAEYETESLADDEDAACPMELGRYFPEVAGQVLTEIWTMAVDMVKDAPVGSTDEAYLELVRQCIQRGQGLQECCIDDILVGPSESQEEVLQESPSDDILSGSSKSQQCLAVLKMARNAVFQQTRQELLLLCTAIKTGQQDLAGQQSAVQLLIARAVRMKCPYPPREQQVAVLQQLLCSKSDVIWIAKTSAGKSLIFQMLPILLQKLVVVLLPLTQIGNEQRCAIQQKGGNPLLFTAETKKHLTKEVIKDLLAGRFTHLLMSPEIFIARWFQKLQQRPAFRSALAAVVIDELHLVHQWGHGKSAFRPAYSQLKPVRCGLASGVQWYGCSATLDAESLAVARLSAGFKHNTVVIRSSIDRPEVAVRAVAIPDGHLLSYRCLFHLTDPLLDEAGQNSPAAIPKTVIFMDSRSGANAAAAAMRTDICSRHSSVSRTEAERIIRLYHGKTAGSTQTRTLDEFRKPGATSAIRILVATEALGLGVDLPDIEHIVQYALPLSCSIRTLWQRAGRAVRTVNNIQGYFTFMYESWASLPKSSAPAGPSRLSSIMPEDILDDALSDGSADSPADSLAEESGDNATVNKRRQKKGRSALSKQEKVDRLEAALHQFIAGKECRRSVILNFFDQDDLTTDNTAVCCDICQPHLVTALEAEMQKLAALPRTVAAKLGYYSRRMHSMLLEWERVMCSQQQPACVFMPAAGTMISSSKLALVAIADQSEHIGDVAGLLSAVPCLADICTERTLSELLAELRRIRRDPSQFRAPKTSQGAAQSMGPGSGDLNTPASRFHSFSSTQPAVRTSGGFRCSFEHQPAASSQPVHSGPVSTHSGTVHESRIVHPQILAVPTISAPPVTLAPTRPALAVISSNIQKRLSPHVLQHQPAKRLQAPSLTRSGRKSVLSPQKIAEGYGGY